MVVYAIVLSLLLKKLSPMFVLRLLPFDFTVIWSMYLYDMKIILCYVMLSKLLSILKTSVTSSLESEFFFFLFYRRTFQISESFFHKVFF